MSCRVRGAKRRKPTSRKRRRRPIPPKLFSHNDQQSIWQSSSPEGSTIGWGGNLGDLMLSGQRNASLFTCISVAGNAVFLSGDEALQYQVGTRGAVRINSVSSAEQRLFDQIAVCPAHLVDFALFATGDHQASLNHHFAQQVALFFDIVIIGISVDIGLDG